MLFYCRLLHKNFGCNKEMILQKNIIDDKKWNINLKNANLNKNDGAVSLKIQFFKSN